MTNSWRDDPEAGFLDGPKMPRPTSTMAETGAAMAGTMRLFLKEPDLMTSLAALLQIEREEAVARFEAWTEWGDLCFEIFRSWCSARGLIAQGYVWGDAIEDDPTFYAQRREPSGL